VTPSSNGGPHDDRAGARERLLRIRVIKNVLDRPTDPPPPKPSARFLVGVAAIAVSYVIAWPAMTALGAVAIYFKRPMWAAVGIPALYGLSWLVWSAGLWLAGPESIVYARRFFRRVAKRFLLR
jgi:hypothetical protein